MTYNDINKLLGISLKTIVNINRGSYAGSPKANYPIRRVRISEDIKAAIREELLTTNKTRQEIADDFDVSLSTVKRIKAQLK
jgi:DNA invertase Pin-like site-specific DNA recombinase